MVNNMSIWNKTVKTRKAVELKEDITVDVLIVGAGITGLTTAYYLKDHPSIAVVDASNFGYGVTLNTTAKVTYFQQRIYTQIENALNKESAQMYLKSQKEAISYLKEIIKCENIICDFKKTPSFVFANTEKEIEPLNREISFLKEQGVDVVPKKLPEKITTYNSYCIEDTYTFHPLKYLSALYDILKSSKVPIYENSPIIEIKQQDDYYNCYSKNAKIKAKRVIFACHYPPLFSSFFLPVHSWIEKSYIIVSEVEKDGGYSCISSSNPTYSTRFYEDKGKIYQICLAESHNIAFNQNDERHFQRVKDIFGLEEKNIIEKYSNIDIMTPDHLPYIGKVKHNMYIGVGYNTWGMTNGVLAGKILSDLIKYQENEFKNLLDPRRRNSSFYLKMPYYLFGQTKSFLGAKLAKKKIWYPQTLTFDREDGTSLGIYIDEQGQKHIVYNKCPHLGCSLIFNKEEKTWDCPCHSSRFTIDGECIKGPSVRDIKYK